jgi:transposase
MRQTHVYGEKLFIDYCGPTIPIVNPDTGECRTAQVFVAVMGGSNYTFAEATWSQKLKDWVMSHVRAFAFFKAVPEILVPDNLRSSTTKACKFDPDLNPTYQQLAAHYNVAIIPARPLRPKDYVAPGIMYWRSLSAAFTLNTQATSQHIIFQL